MTKTTTSRRLRFWFWVVLLGGYSAAVAGVVVDAIRDSYRRLSQVELTTTDAPESQRALGAAQIAALHRAQSDTPLRTLPVGETFRVVWPDGSSELVRVVSQTSDHGARPVPGSQIAADALLQPAAQPELQVMPVSTATPSRRDPATLGEATLGEASVD